MKRRLLLVGWKSAVWKILNPLLDGGELPNLGRIINEGASGRLLTVQPPVSDTQWTALATGKRPWQGRAATLWEILARRNLDSIVAGWPGTHGKKPDHTRVISDRYSEPTAPPGVKSWPPAAAGTYWPENLGKTFDGLRISPADVAADVVARYIPEWRKVDQKRDRRLGQLRVLLAADFSYSTAIVGLMTTQPWDFAAVRFPALGALAQIFAAGVFCDVINSHCRMLDLMLGNLTGAAGRETAVAVISSEVFAAAGPGFARDALLHGASILDVAPTILTWLGLPIGDDMEGRVLMEAFAETMPVERVPTWESPSQQTKPAPVDWTWAQSRLEAGGYQEALPVLMQLFHTFPERAETSHAFFQCLLTLGKVAEAEEILEVVLEALPEGAIPLLVQAELALASRDHRRAHALVEEAQQLKPIHPDVLRRLGILLLRLREWDALAALATEALRRDESDSLAWLGLAEAQLRQSRPAEAAESARRAIGLRYFLAGAHFVLARALVAQGRWAEAQEAMSILLKIQPGHRTAPAYLKRLRRAGDAASQ